MDINIQNSRLYCFCHQKLIFIVCFLLASSALFAYKGGSHVLLTRSVLNSIEKDGDKYYVVLQPQGNDTISSEDLNKIKFEIKDPELKEIIEDKTYHPYFYSGALGPDSFPDIISGQIQIHVNRGQELELTKIANSTSSEKRSVDQWRSIDYGMYLIDSAKKFKEEGSSKRKEALAFAYGYLFHMLQDANEHDILNSFTRLPFTLTDGEGPFGGATPALQHIALEVSHLNEHVKKAKADSRSSAFIDGVISDKSTIEIPFEFLKEVYTAPNAEKNVSPGAVGGEVIGYLTQIKGLLEIIKDPKLMEHLSPKMNENTIRNIIPDKLVNSFVSDTPSAIPSATDGVEQRNEGHSGNKYYKYLKKATEVCYDCLHEFAQKHEIKMDLINSKKDKNIILKTVLDKISETEHNSIDLRIEFIDNMIDNWIKLSECVAKNILKGDFTIDSKKDDLVIADSCLNTDFKVPKNSFVSEREFYNVVHSKNEVGVSPTDIGYNVKKIVGLLKLVLMQLAPFNLIISKDTKPFVPEPLIAFYEYCNCKNDYERSNLGTRIFQNDVLNMTADFCKIFKNIKKIKKRIELFKNNLEKRLLYGVVSPFVDEVIKRTNIDELANTMKQPAEILSNIFFLDQDLKGNPDYLNEIMDHIGPCGETLKANLVLEARPQLNPKKSCEENAISFSHYKRDAIIECIMKVPFRHPKRQEMTKDEVLSHPEKIFDPIVNISTNAIRDEFLETFTIKDPNKAGVIWDSLIKMSVCYVQGKSDSTLDKVDKVDKVFEKSYTGFHVDEEHSQKITLLGELFFKNKDVRGPTFKKWQEVTNSRIIDNNSNNLVRLALGHDLDYFRNTLRSLDDPNGVGPNAGKKARFFPWASPPVEVSGGNASREGKKSLTPVPYVPIFDSSQKIYDLFYQTKVFVNPQELF